jgi:chaperonin GroEL
MKQIRIQGQEARDALNTAIQLLASIVESSYGPIGRKTVIDDVNAPTPHIVNDGIRILSHIQPANPIENSAKKLLLNAANNTNIFAGDGTTTTVILTSRMIEAVLGLVNKGYNPLDIEIALNLFKEDIIKHLNKVDRKISKKSEMAELAYISCRDQRVANIIAEFCFKVGKEAQTRLETTSGDDIETEIIDNGFYADTDVLDPMFFQDQTKLETIIKNPAILFATRAVSGQEELINAMRFAREKGHSSLVVICNDMKDTALTLAKATVDKQNNSDFKVYPLKAPEAFEKQVVFMEDMAALTGATVINHGKGQSLLHVLSEDLGTCEELRFNPYKTTIIGGKQNKQKVEERKAQVNNLMKDTGFTKDIGFLFVRKQALTNKIGVLKVGAMTAVEGSDLYTRIEDALRTVESAQQYGIVEGGGFTLSKFGATYENDKIDVNILFALRTVLCVPTMLLSRSVGMSNEDREKIINPILQSGKGGYDFRARTVVEDLYKSGINDSKYSVQYSILNAISIAVSVMFVDSLLINEE